MSQLNIQDIVILEQVIRVCQSRGAIQAQEMTKIGAVYDKLLKIINDVKEKAEQSQKRLPTVDEEEDEEEKKM